jgi:hypothetical protein
MSYGSIGQSRNHFSKLSTDSPEFILRHNGWPMTDNVIETTNRIAILGMLSASLAA